MAGSVSAAAVTLVISGTAGVRSVIAASAVAHRLGGRRQQPAVERGADREQHAAPRPLRLGQGRPPARPRRAAPLTTTWPGALSLATSQTPIRLASAAISSTLLELEAENRGHGALADRHRRLHRVAAHPQQARRVADIEAAGRGQGRVLAQRMAGDAVAEIRELAAAPRLERAECGERGRHQRRLGVLGQTQPLLGPLEDQAAQRLSERLVDPFEHLARRRHRVMQRPAHADGLRPLTRKDEGCWHAALSKLDAAARS